MSVPRSKAWKTGAYASKYRGVSFEPSNKNFPWRVRIGGGPGKKFIEVGRYANEEAAGRAYDAAARHKLGDKAILNFSPVAADLLVSAIKLKEPTKPTRAENGVNMPTKPYVESRGAETVTLWIKDPVKSLLREATDKLGLSRAETSRIALAAGLPLVLNPPTPVDGVVRPQLSDGLQEQLATFALLNLAMQRLPDGLIARILAPQMGRLLGEIANAEGELSDFLG